MSRPLILALALSLALHGGLLFPDALKRLSAAPPPPALQATLRLPPRPEPPAAEPLLKNTLETEKRPEPAPPPKPTPPPAKAAPKAPPRAKPATRPALQREVQAAQKKLSEYVFYPEAARVRGIEGTVRLLLVLAEDGAVEDVRVIASSGHAILDNAAAKGGWALQKLPGSKTRELPLDYTFRLLP